MQKLINNLLSNTILLSNSEVLFMKYNSIGEQLIAKAKELDPNYKPDKFNDMSEALNIILNNIVNETKVNELINTSINDVINADY